MACRELWPSAGRGGIPSALRLTLLTVLASGQGRARRVALLWGQPVSDGQPHGALRRGYRWGRRLAARRRGCLLRRDREHGQCSERECGAPRDRDRTPALSADADRAIAVDCIAHLAGSL